MDFEQLQEEHCHQEGKAVSLLKLPVCLYRMATPDFMTRTHKFTLCNSGNEMK